jgi:hypothetical protein
MSTFLRPFLDALDARLEHDGHLSGNEKARALGVDPATWSRARRGLAHFPSRVVEAGLNLYPDLSYFLAPRQTTRTAA